MGSKSFYKLVALSLRGAKRRGNLVKPCIKELDCFLRSKCVVAMTNLWIIILLIIFSFSASADETHHAGEHGGQIFHHFTLETDIGNSREGAVASWDFDGWIGNDENKLWLKSEGEQLESSTSKAEFWAMYSRNISDFWDAQIGLRQDVQPEQTTYLAIGFDGLAPYFFETQAHIFISDRGDTSIRIRQENDFLLTQKIVFQPYLEINIFAQDVENQDIGVGISDAEIGLQTRYEITRKFAPYIDFRYERKFAGTSDIAKIHGEDIDDFITSIGVKLMF